MTEDGTVCLHFPLLIWIFCQVMMKPADADVIFVATKFKKHFLVQSKVVKIQSNFRLNACFIFYWMHISDIFLPSHLSKGAIVNILHLSKADIRNISWMRYSINAKSPLHQNSNTSKERVKDHKGMQRTTGHFIWLYQDIVSSLPIVLIVPIVLPGYCIQLYDPGHSTKRAFA